MPSSSFIKEVFFLLVGSWGTYNWFEEDGEELIEMHSLENFKNLNPVGKLFQ